ncbi:hypothetical protein [Pedococcus sp. 5OH_020]|uniref:hypothetical protein n=1 Tax=Pedococcus sp. 5OH_020 TaxID=2989814 RepID=UPI0022E9D550|nr:hypothetical protein [Pedococcus sp. 5OH_020]
MQRARRTNPYPFTWEIPMAAVVATVLLVVLGIHAGGACANLVAGGGLILPSRETLFTSVPAVLGGDAGAGLSGTAAHLAGATAVRVWVAVVEAVVLTLTVRVAKVGLGRWGPGRIQGMATREEAERLLGRSRLRKVGAVVRPDLYGKGR